MTGRGWSRTVTLANPFNILTTIKETTTTDLNGRTLTAVLDIPARQWATTTPERRIIVSRFDAQRRQTFAQQTGVEAISTSYDLRGRLACVTQGTRADHRSLVYA